MRCEVEIHPVKIGYTFEVLEDRHRLILKVRMYNGICPETSFESLIKAREYFMNAVAEQLASWEEEILEQRKCETSFGTPAHEKSLSLHCYSYTSIDEKNKCVEFHYGMTYSKTTFYNLDLIVNSGKAVSGTFHSGPDLKKAFPHFKKLLLKFCKEWISQYQNEYIAMVKRLTPKYCSQCIYQMKIYRMLSRERFVIPVI